MYDDRRLIEDFLPIQAISAEAPREKSFPKGHVSTPTSDGANQKWVLHETMRVENGKTCRSLWGSKFA